MVQSAWSQSGPATANFADMEAVVVSLQPRWTFLSELDLALRAFIDIPFQDQFMNYLIEWLDWNIIILIESWIGISSQDFPTII
jgi:hypothetical protein